MLRIFNVKKGDDFSFTLRFKDLPVDLDTCRFGIKSSYESETMLIEKTLNNGIDKIDTGIYRVTIPHTDTDALKADQYVYDLRFTVGSIISTPLSGIINIEETVFD